METGQFRYVLGLSVAGLVALGGFLGIIDEKYWGAVGVLIAMTVADQIKHRNS